MEEKKMGTFFKTKMKKRLVYGDKTGTTVHDILMSV